MITLIQKWLDATRRWIVAIGAIGILYLVLWSARYLDFYFGWYLLTIPIFYYGAVLIEKMLAWAVFKFSWLRKWILGGTHFIEGHWIEILLENNKMQSVAILQIVYEFSNQYTIKGESYTLIGEYRGSFVTPNTAYSTEEIALKYAYAGKYKESLIAGTGVLTFEADEKSKIPTKFSGHLLDNFHFKGATFYGEKIEDVSKIATLRAKKDFLFSYVSEQVAYQKARIRF
jgi:hypothetical protein